MYLSLLCITFSSPLSIFLLSGAYFSPVSMHDFFRYVYINLLSVMGVAKFFPVLNLPFNFIYDVFLTFRHLKMFIQAVHDSLSSPAADMTKTGPLI